VSCSPLFPHFKRFWTHFHQHQTVFNHHASWHPIDVHQERQGRPVAGTNVSIRTVAKPSAAEPWRLFQRCVVKMGGISGSSWVIQWIISGFQEIHSAKTEEIQPTPLV